MFNNRIPVLTGPLLLNERYKCFLDSVSAHFSSSLLLLLRFNWFCFIDWWLYTWCCRGGSTACSINTIQWKRTSQFFTNTYVKQFKVINLTYDVSTMNVAYSIFWIPKSENIQIDCLFRIVFSYVRFILVIFRISACENEC